MELIIKLYTDKPSKIGIKFPQEYSAVRAYEDIYNKNAGDSFFVKMEMIRDKIDLVLTSELTGERISYRELDYKTDQLKKLEAFFGPGKSLEFVHIFSKTNTLMIAKPFRSRKFITLTNYEIVGPGSFANRI